MECYFGLVLVHKEYNAFLSLEWKRKGEEETLCLMEQEVEIRSLLLDVYKN